MESDVLRFSQRVVGELTQKNQNLENQLRDLKKENIELKRRASTSANPDLEAQVRDLKKENTELKRKYAHSHQDVEKLQKDVASLSHQLSEARNQISQLKAVPPPLPPHSSSQIPPPLPPHPPPSLAASSTSTSLSSSSSSSSSSSLSSSPPPALYHASTPPPITVPVPSPGPPLESPRPLTFSVPNKRGQTHPLELSSPLDGKPIQLRVQVPLPNLPETVIPLDFARDSPFFRSLVLSYENRVNTFGSRLKKLIAASKNFCDRASQLAQASKIFSQELLLDWSEVESDLGKDSGPKDFETQSSASPHSPSVSSNLIHSASFPSTTHSASFSSSSHLPPPPPFPRPGTPQSMTVDTTDLSRLTASESVSPRSDSIISTTSTSISTSTSSVPTSVSFTGPDISIHRRTTVTSDETQTPRSQQQQPQPQQIEAASLNCVASKLGTVLSTLSSITENLRMNFEDVLVKSLLDFRHDNIKAANLSRENLDKLTSIYEGSLHHYMLKKLPKIPTTPVHKLSLTSKNKHDEKTDRDEKEHLGMLKRQFELARFDHVKLLNEIRSIRRLKLIENLLSSFYAFITFFHEGGDEVFTIQKEIEQVHRQIEPKRKLYNDQSEKFKKQRDTLEQALGFGSETLNVRVEKVHIFSPKRPLNIGRGGKELLVEKEGYLYKQSTNLKKDWKRRWFALQKGQLVYFRNYKDLTPQHVVNVLICRVRENNKAELRYVFDLISPNRRVYTLQAETEDEMKEWMEVMQNCTESLITAQPDLEAKRSTSGSISPGTSNGLEVSERKKIFDKLRQLNPECADCGSRDPDWCAINLGILICISCSGVHRSLGVHISKVRSLTMDAWDMQLLELLVCLGNEKINKVWDEGRPQGIPKPTPTATREERDEYIHNKYEKRAFLSKELLSASPSTEARQKQFLDCAGRDDVSSMLSLFALGIEMDWQDDRGQTALHRAAENDSALALEYLLLNNAKSDIRNSDGLLAVDIAKGKEAHKVLNRLNKKL